MLEAGYPAGGAPPSAALGMINLGPHIITALNWLCVHAREAWRAVSARKP
ncbi:MAG TPA: hypothetical protein VG733_01975 [Chthoniobacteraceae bacterium]|nr:hypothetical protein [Chthoniobacteraceae bacterium]